MKMTISPEGRGKEVLSPVDGRWYKRGQEYEVSFSDAIRMKADPKGTFLVEMPYDKFTYDPQVWAAMREVAILQSLDPNSGWGNCGTNLIKYSPHIKFAQVGTCWGVTEPLVTQATRRPVLETEAAIWHQQPKADWIMSPFGRNIAITPFETTQVPMSWVPRLNAMDAVFVPCKQNIGMMVDSGVSAPVHLIHWGVDTDKFHPVERSPDRPFTFGHMGMLSKRKGTDILVRAFQAAFPKEKDVRLICKTSDRHYPFMVHNEKRIIVKMGAVEHQELMQDFFSEIDCFVFPTKGEGFGLTPLEAMATGIPAIVTGWSGPLEYMTSDIGWTIDYTMDYAEEFDKNVYGEYCGEWAIPKFDHLVHLMRYAYEHPDEVRMKGAAAAQHVAQSWTWAQQIGLFHDALERYL